MRSVLFAVLAFAAAVIVHALLGASPALAAVPSVSAPETAPDLVLLTLAAGIAVLKLVMGLLDKARALEKLPAWLRPIVAMSLAAVLAFLEHLVSGGDLFHAIQMAIGIFAGNQGIHALIKGIVDERTKKTPASR